MNTECEAKLSQIWSYKRKSASSKAFKSVRAPNLYEVNPRHTWEFCEPVRLCKTHHYIHKSNLSVQPDEKQGVVLLHVQQMVTDSEH